MKKAYLIYSIMFFLFLATGCGEGKDSSSLISLKKDYGEATLFSLPDLDGRIVNLEDLIGKKIILLYFQKTNCPHCLAIIPRLNKLNDGFKDKLEIIAIDIGGRSSRLKSFVENRGIKYKVLIDTKNQVADQYFIVGVPTLFVLDLQGKVKYVGHDFEKAEKTIFKLLDEKVRN